MAEREYDGLPCPECGMFECVCIEDEDADWGSNAPRDSLWDATAVEDDDDDE